MLAWCLGVRILSRVTCWVVRYSPRVLLSIKITIITSFIIICLINLVMILWTIILNAPLQVLRCYSPPSCLQSGVGKVPLKVFNNHIISILILHVQHPSFNQGKHDSCAAHILSLHIPPPVNSACVVLCCCITCHLIYKWSLLALRFALGVRMYYMEKPQSFLSTAVLLTLPLEWYGI